MKRKHRRDPAKNMAKSPRAWLVFRKKAKPMIGRKGYRKARALAAANKRAYLCFTLALGLTAALFVIILAVPPQMSSEQLAAAVKAQMVLKKRDNSQLKTPASLPSVTQDSEELV